MTNELDRLRADLKSMSEYAMKLDASNDDYQAELARTTAGLELSRQVASSLDEALEAANARIEQQNMIIHGLQDGALARDQMGVIDRLEARIEELENACKEWQGAFEVEKGDHSEDVARAERAEARIASLMTGADRYWEERYREAVASVDDRSEHIAKLGGALIAADAKIVELEAERDAMREVCIGVDHVASIEERYGGHVSWTNTWIETVAKARAALGEKP